MEEEIIISGNIQNIKNTKEIVLGLLNKIYLLNEELNTLRAENKRMSLLLKPCKLPERDMQVI